jgi:hypothetical protein
MDNNKKLVIKIEQLYLSKTLLGNYSFELNLKKPIVCLVNNAEKHSVNEICKDTA